MRPIMSELRNHRFITQVGDTPDLIRKSIVKEMELVRALGQIRREPEVTAKHGKLKAERQAGFQTIFVDDLASLGTTDEVRTEF